MTEPLKQDQRVIADTSIDGVYPDGTAYVIPIVLEEEGKDFWRYPLDDPTVERLAKVACEFFFHGRRPFEDVNDSAQEHWQKVVRLIFAELMGERP